jgi:hypothetical protein
MTKGICVWFDKFIPEKKDAMCTTDSANMIKARDDDQNKDIWSSMAKIHAMEEQLETFLIAADAEAQDANHTFSLWSAAPKGKEKDTLKYYFVEAKDNYTFTIQDAKDIRIEEEKAIEESNKLLDKDKDPFVVTTTTTGAPAPVVTADLLMAATPPPAANTPPPVPTPTPQPLKWRDFPNSEDTQWSLRHPECPQGPPCFCNCKCHGAPYQNFVEPLPPPPAPCPPPPPTPDPRRLSTPMGAPPALPLR